MHSHGELGLFRLWKRAIGAEMRALSLLSTWRLQLLSKSCIARVGPVRVHEYLRRYPYEQGDKE